MAYESTNEGRPDAIEYTRYAPERLFQMSKVARSGPKALREKPLATARKLISRGLTALSNDRSRIAKIWKRLSGHDK